MNSIYHINKGINKPIEFKGLKAQYIGYLAVGLVFLLVLFAVLYISGLNLFFCLMLIMVLGTGLFFSVLRLSHTYGQYGLMKRLARNSIPSTIRFRSRKVFILLKSDYGRN